MLFMLAWVSVTLCMFSALGYFVGRNTPAELRFLEPRRAPTMDEAIITYPVEYSLRSQEKNDAIFVGDSTCRSGIDPAEFERLTGLRAYNLGSQGKAGPMAYTLTAMAYLSKHPAPRVVVYCISPVVFDFGHTRDDSMRDRLLANYGPEVPGLFPWTQSILYFIKRGSVTALGAPWAWIAGRREDVREVPLVGMEMDTYRTLGERTLDAKGYGRLPGRHYSKIHRMKDLGLEWQGKPVAIPDEWTRGAEQLAETCQERGIPVLLRFSPLPAHCAPTRDFSPLTKWSESLARSCPGLTVGSPILLWYDWSLCWDTYHVNSEGVAKFTSAVAAEVRAVVEKSSRPNQK